MAAETPHTFAGWREGEACVRCPRAAQVAERKHPTIPRICVPGADTRIVSVCGGLVLCSDGLISNGLIRHFAGIGLFVSRIRYLLGCNCVAVTVPCGIWSNFGARHFQWSSSLEHIHSYLPTRGNQISHHSSDIYQLAEMFICLPPTSKVPHFMRQHACNKQQNSESDKNMVS